MSRTTLAAGLLLLAISNASAGSPEQEVLVRVSESSWVPGPVLAMGQRIASRILLSAGVRLRWENHRSTPAPIDACAPGAVETVDLQFSYSTTKGYKPGALASALPFGRSGVRITVFYDRVELHPETVSTPIMLGHTLAHEIGHVLLRNNAHTNTGLMRPWWGPDDFHAMFAGELHFLPSHALQMRWNLAEACAGSDREVTAANRQP